MKNNISLYFISKPLQYFNVTNIDDENTKHLMVIDSFKDSYILADRASQVDYWEKVEVFSTYDLAFESVDVTKYTKLYIDSDYGYSKTSFLKKFKNVIINVYEEGAGTYINNLRSTIEHNLGLGLGLGKIKSFLIKLIYRFYGHYDFHGGSKFTNNIYVYDVENYKQGKFLKGKNVLTFKNSFINHIQSPLVRKVLYPIEIDFLHLEKQDVLLYVSNWYVDVNVMEQIKNQFNTYFKIVKLHPHIKMVDQSSDLFLSSFNTILNGGEMLEFYIESLLQAKCRLTILHHGTSALSYFNDYPFLEIQIKNK